MSTHSVHETFHLVEMGVGHKVEAASSAIGVIWIWPCPLFSLLEKWQHVLPSPAWISKALPLVKVLAVSTEVNHPIQHTEIKGRKKFGSLDTTEIG